MFDALSDKLQRVFSRLSSHGTVSEKDLDEALREVRVALLEADVNFRVVREFVSAVRERAAGADVLQSLTGPQQVISIVNEELTNMLGGTSAPLAVAAQPPTVVLLVGLKGGGKTTFASKLALHLRKSGQKPLLIAADPYRVAASEQLQALGRQHNVPVFAADAKDVKRLAKGALEEAKKIGATALIVDSAGYLQLDEDVVEELQLLESSFKPHETLLVVDAMTGQEAVNVAEEFRKALPVSGFVLTKLDGDARGGAALSIRAVTGLPVKFIGTGERADALEPFHPERFASRILGMGDVLTLIEKAQAQIGEDEVVDFGKRAKANQLDLNDFVSQLQRVKQMGPIGDLLSMVPGMGNIKRQLQATEIDDTFFKHAEAIVSSMTPEERRNPDLIGGSRRKRIAAGSGTTPQDVNQLLKQWKEAKKVMQQLASGRTAKLMGIR
ncbi:MAG TPA: signal recognition particle protein [Dehalococcoidia bacterium]|nr:signal recognition particle protein [Dehalococcoidia bacterium]